MHCRWQLKFTQKTLMILVEAYSHLSPLFCEHHVSLMSLIMGTGINKSTLFYSQETEKSLDIFNITLARQQAEVEVRFLSYIEHWYTNLVTVVWIVTFSIQREIIQSTIPLQECVLLYVPSNIAVLVDRNLFVLAFVSRGKRLGLLMCYFSPGKQGRPAHIPSRDEDGGRGVSGLAQLDVELGRTGWGRNKNKRCQNWG